jgi:hypothetical protein
MASLPQVVMPIYEIVEVDFAEEARQKLEQYCAGILCRKVIGGLKCNEADPNDDGPPRAQKIGMGTWQSQALPYSSA